MADSSRFLTLPGEIRNQIFEDAIDDITTLRINKNGFLVPPALSTVCRQIHAEFQASKLLQHSLASRSSILKVEAEVTDFKFAHVVKFLDRVAQHGFTKVDELGIRLKSTGRQVDDKDVASFINLIETDDGCRGKCERTIDVGHQIRQPVTVRYDVDMRHKVDEDLCPCTDLLATLADIEESQASSSLRRCACFELGVEISDSHKVAVKAQLEREMELRMKQYIRNSERENGTRGRFWLERLRQAHLNGKNVSTLQHTFLRPVRVQKMLFAGMGTRPTQTDHQIEYSTDDFPNLRTYTWAEEGRFALMARRRSKDVTDRCRNHTRAWGVSKAFRY